MSETLDPLLAEYPSASGDALAEAIASYIETCFPEVLRSVALPRVEVPSLTQVALRTLRKTRAKRRVRNAFQAISSRETFLRELYSLRNELDRSGKAGTSAIRMREYDGNLRTTPTALKRPSATDTPVKPRLVTEEDGITRRPSRLEPTASFLPYTGPNLLATKQPKIAFSLNGEMTRALADDACLQDVLRTVEVNLRTAAMQSEKEMDFQCSLETDPEYPRWKRYVVTIDVEDEFDRKMELWRQLNAQVRHSLRELRELKPQYSDRVEDIGKNLFLHMELT